MSKSAVLTLLLGSIFLAACTPTAATPPAAVESTPPALTVVQQQPATSAPTSTATFPPLALVTAVVPTPEPTVTPVVTTTPAATVPPVSPSPTPAVALSFAAIGDYGGSVPSAREVAALVDSRNPDLVITLGDNNYPDGASWTIEENITANYGRFVAEDRFFPTLGNHDLITDNGQAYFDYFDLPGNERYYDFVRGDVHFFAVNSDWREPDGINAGSVQADWLRQRLAASSSAWQVVYFHAPPFVSMEANQVAAMDWPFADWGADLVLSGHAHLYERLQVGGLTYVVNGLGGYTIYPFDEIPRPESIVRYNQDFGALFLEATAGTLSGQFISRAGVVADTWTQTKN